MKLIVGLGNPGDRYATTRHNVGFHVVERLAADHGWRWDAQRDKAILAQGLVGGRKIVLAKPHTFMNDSGLSVGPLMRFFKLELADLLVICDDLDLPTGRVRLREKGSSGGQRGVNSIIAHLGSNAFARLRVGIGRPPDPRMDPVAHVLSAPSGDDRAALEDGERRAVAATLVWAQEGVTAAMNLFNPDPQAHPKPKPVAPDPADPPA